MVVNQKGLGAGDSLFKSWRSRRLYLLNLIIYLVYIFWIKKNLVSLFVWVTLPSKNLPHPKTVMLM